MSAATYTTQTGKHETVEDLMRYAASQFGNARLPFQQAKASKLIRRELRAGDIDVRRIIDAWVDQADDSATWAGFELFALGGYADPTAALATVRLDNARKRVSAR